MSFFEKKTTKLLETHYTFGHYFWKSIFFIILKNGQKIFVPSGTIRTASEGKISRPKPGIIANHLSKSSGHLWKC